DQGLRETRILHVRHGDQEVVLEVARKCLGHAAWYWARARGGQEQAGSGTGNAISGFEAPGAGDLEQAAFGQIPGKGRERCGQTYDAQGGVIQYLMTRGLDQLDAVEAAVTANGHAQHQAAVDALTARLGRVVLVADALDLATPGVHVEGPRIPAGRGGIE